MNQPHTFESFLLAGSSGRVQVIAERTSERYNSGSAELFGFEQVVLEFEILISRSFRVEEIQSFHFQFHALKIAMFLLYPRPLLKNELLHGLTAIVSIES